MTKLTGAYFIVMMEIHMENTYMYLHVDIHRHTNITIYLTYTCAHKGTCITCLTITLTLLH